MPTLDHITLYGPAILIFIAFVWGFARIFQLRRRDGVSVLAVAGRKRSPVELLLGLIAVVLDGYLLARPIWPVLDETLGTIPFAYGHWGVALMALGIGIAVFSQVDMGRSWRIGIPAEVEDSQSLVTGGLYQFSRNPIYVGIMMFLVGAAIVVPGPLTIASVVLTYFLVSSIIRSEEAFLEAEFGEEFSAYKNRVRRWL